MQKYTIKRLYYTDKIANFAALLSINSSRRREDAKYAK
jgi:hypothetical protein